VIVPRVVHTAHLEAAELVAIRRLLDLAFAGRFDWMGSHLSIAGIERWTILLDARRP